MYFTIVIAIDTIQIDKLKEFICELQSTSYYRSNLLEIIVIDPLNVRALEDFLKQMDNICYHKFESKNLASIYNFSLDKISGKYINFTKASAYYSARSLKEVDKIFQHSDAGCVCMLPYTQTSDGKKTQYHHLNRKKSHHNIYLKPDENNLCLGSYFIAINKFKHFVFDEILYDEALYKYIINVLVIAGKYYSVSCEYIMSNSNEDLFCESLLSFEKRWYNDSLSNFIMPLILSYPQTLFVQNIILYFLSCKMAANQDQFDKKILNDEEIEIFLATIREILLKIDDSVIENFSYPNVPGRYKNIFYSLKYNTYEYLPTFNGTAFVKNYPLFRVNEYYVYIMSMDYCSSEESLHIDCKIDCKELFSNDESDARIEIELDNVSYKTETNNVYSHIKIFGKKMHQSYTFDANIDISYIDNSSKLCFYYCVGNYRQKMHIRFRAKSPARLNKKYKSYYWRFKDDAIIYYDHGVGGLGFKQVNRFYIFKRELLLYREFIQKCNSKKLIFKVIALRGLYWLTKPYYKNKKIWITFDKLYKAGDNGEYFFNYCRSQKSRFDCFYIINQTANDYSRLKGNKGILRFKSIRQYLTSLNCEIMFSTHANPYSFNGFSKKSEEYFRDLFKFDNFCLQHGLTIQEIANIQNRVFDNTKLYFCASKYEIKNLMQDEYDYCRFDYLRLTGSPRYDKLLDQANRTILIAPTWRNNAANHKTKTGSTRAYIDTFKNSKYFMIYNRLLQNEKLLDCVKKYNYKLNFLLHPTLTEQAEDFSQNGIVDILTVTGEQSYEKLLKEASLLITDYSGIQYDFAYMNKPIIYFHPSELPPHYDSVIDYNTHGFGPIIKSNDRLIDEIISNIESSCKIEEKYLSRIQDFFTFHDHNNCRRIYDEAIIFAQNK